MKPQSFKNNENKNKNESSETEGEYDFFEKDNIRISKTKDQEYQLQCEINNPRLVLEKIVDFEILKLIYDLNTDVYEKTELYKINDNEANIIFIMKNLFPDLGLPQRFSFLKVKKIVEKDSLTNKTSQIVFLSQMIVDEKREMVKPEHLPKDVFPLPIEKMETHCVFINEHKIQIINKIKINHGKLMIPGFLEKMLSKIIFKVFSRVKQFIENFTL